MKIFLLTLLIISTPFHDDTSVLKVQLTGLKSTNGTIYTQLFNQEGEMVARKSVTPEEDITTIEFRLQPGKYAIRSFHDENGNGRLDTTLFGIPRERYGYSNNVRGFMGEPAFRRQLFTFQKDTTITIRHR